MRQLQWVGMLLLLTGCISDVPGNLGLDDYDRQVVVNAELASGEVPELQIVWSQSILDNGAFEGIGNARVSLVSANDSIEFFSFADGNYFGDKAIEAETDYHLEVQVGEQVVSASDRIPAPIQLDVVDYRDSVGTSTGQSGVIGSLNLTFTDPPNTPNFYEVRVFQINGDEERYCDLWTNNLNVINTNNTDAFSDFKNQISRVLLPDAAFEGQPITLELGVALLSAERDLHVRLKSVSPPYFDYLKAIAKIENNGDSPFLEPITIPSNVLGGLGNVVGYSFDEVLIER